MHEEISSNEQLDLPWPSNKGEGANCCEVDISSLRLVTCNFIGKTCISIMHYSLYLDVLYIFLVFRILVSCVYGVLFAVSRIYNKS